MKRAAIAIMTFALGAAVVFAAGSTAWAAPPISIDLRVDQQSFAYDEPIGVEVELCNTSENDVFINEEVLSQPYYLELRVLDPAGKLILASHQAVGTESPDAPPLAWRQLSDGTVVQVAGCEVLPPGCRPVSRSEDMRQDYALDLPGWYSAQVKLSVMAFADEQCNADEPDFVGVLKSQFSYFNVQGSPDGVRINPDQWKQFWSDPDKKTPNVQVQLRPDAGKAVEDYDEQSIRMSYNGNQISPMGVRVQPKMIKAYFDVGQAIGILGATDVGQWYWVTISGRYKSGQPFGKQQKIRIVN